MWMIIDLSMLSMRDYEGDYNYLFDLKVHPFKHEEEFKSVFTDKEESFPFYCEWIIYQNSSGKRFSLLYFRAEAMSVYFTLYTMNRVAPKIVVILILIMVHIVGLILVMRMGFLLNSF
jgi:hypothetical protein